MDAVEVVVVGFDGKNRSKLMDSYNGLGRSETQRNSNFIPKSETQIVVSNELCVCMELCTQLIPDDIDKINRKIRIAVIASHTLDLIWRQQQLIH